MERGQINHGAWQADRKKAWPKVKAVVGRFRPFTKPLLDQAKHYFLTGEGEQELIYRDSRIFPYVLCWQADQREANWPR